MSRVQPVFVSSTFRDMHAERDHLARFVFPELTEAVRSLGFDLISIDLRWGVDTSAVPGEAKELAVLRVCLGEIERSRPFFIALLGDRYGWMAPPEQVRRAADEVGFDVDAGARSITALEIEFGALVDPAVRSQTFVYLRRPLPYAQMEPATAARFSDEWAGEGGREPARLLTELKARLNRELGPRVRHYDATWDGEGQRVTGLEGFGRLVLDDLLTECRARASEVAPVPARWQEQESAEVQGFVTDRRGALVGRHGLVDQIVSEVLTPDPTRWGTCLVAEPGMGKSSVFAEVIGRVQAEPGVLTLAHVVGITPRSTSVDAMLERWIGVLEGHLGLGVSEAHTRSELANRFAELLSTAAQATVVVVAVDALDQLEGATPGNRIGWLPELWPVRARLLATAIPGGETVLLERRGGVSLVPVPPLDQETALALVRRVCDRYRRALPSRVEHSVLARTRDDGTPASDSPLWLQLVLEQLLVLDADDFASVAAYGGSPAEQIEQLLVDTVQRLPAEVEAAHRALYDHVEEVHGVAVARGVVHLLAVSRAGLRESDLRVLLPNLTGEPWDDLRFAALRRSLRGHLVARHEAGRWDFAHATARREALRGIPSSEMLQLHAAIAGHLSALPVTDPLRVAELMYHLIGAGDREGAVALYARDPSESSTRALVSFLATADDLHRAIAWTASLLTVASGDTEIVAGVRRNYLYTLLPTLDGELPVTACVGVAHAVRDALSSALEASPDDESVRRDLRVCQNRIGTMLVDAGQLDGAERAHAVALELAEEGHARRPDDTSATLDLAFTLRRAGHLDQMTGNIARARQRYQRSFELIGEGFEQDPRRLSAIRDMGTAAHDMGVLERHAGNVAAAVKWLEDAIGLRDALVADDPDDLADLSALAMTLSHHGELSLQAGDLGGAESSLRRSLELRARVLHERPDDARAAKEVAAGCHQIGNLAMKCGDMVEAIATTDRALAIQHDLHRRSPDSLHAARNLAVGNERQGDLLASAGDPSGALAAHAEALRLREEVYEQSPSSVQATRELAISHERLGNLQFKAGDLSAAARSQEAAMMLREALYAQMPESAEINREYAASKLNLGDVRLKQTRAEEAQRAYEDALALGTELLRQQPESALALTDVLACHQRLGALYLHLGDLDAAVSAFEQALLLAEECHRGSPGRSDLLSHVGTCLRNLLTALARSGDKGRAAIVTERLIELQPERRTQAPASLEDADEMAAELVLIGEYHKSGGRFAASAAAFAGAAAIGDDMMRQGRLDADRKRRLAFEHLRASTMMNQAGDEDGRRSEAAAGRALFAELREAGIALGDDIERLLTTMHRGAGEEARDRGDLDGALVEYELALDLARDLARRLPDSDTAAEDLVTTLHKVGDVSVQRGDVDGARLVYEEAAALAGEAAGRSPESDGVAAAVATSHERLGDLHRRAGDLDTARGHYLDALSGRQAVLHRSPDSAKAAREVSVCHERLGDLSVRVGDLDGAIAEFESVQATVEALAERAPDSVETARDLAMCHERLGDVYRQRGDLDQAQARFEAAHAIDLELFRRQPDSIRAARTLWVGQNKLGDLHLARGDLDASQAAYAAASITAEDLCRRVPDSVQASRDLSITHTGLGDVCARRGDYDGATAHYRSSLVVAEGLASRMPDSAEAARDVAVRHERLAGVARAQGRDHDLTVHLRTCRMVLQGMRARGMSLDPPVARLLERLEADPMAQ